ncbi:DUF2497 domain-containing protein [Aquabacter spiritensis]|nr:DUF2497 domain-containing protein [Aquabacter spiritensis]
MAAVEQERMEADIMADYPFQAPQGSVFPPAGPRAADPTAQRPAPARPPEATAFRSPPEPAARTPRRDVPPRDLPPRDLPPRDLPLRKELLSPDVDAAVSAAFESLGDLRVPAHERTVEDLVKEILRPMLKTWLDDNLPRIVERLVRQEIERVSRTAR